MVNLYGIYIKNVLKYHTYMSYVRYHDCYNIVSSSDSVDYFMLLLYHFHDRFAGYKLNK